MIADSSSSIIVYACRFVFYECTSMKLDDKVTFPLVGLSVGRHLYDLYACVCHFGGVYYWLRKNVMFSV